MSGKTTERNDKGLAEQMGNSAAKKPEKVKIVHEKTTEYLKYDFTEEEIRDMSTEMAQKTIQAEQLKNKAKSVASDFKAQVDAALLTTNTLARKVQDKHEYRNINCMKHLNFDTGMVKIIRVDTGEVVKERKMNSGEKQMTITGYERGESHEE